MIVLVFGFAGLALVILVCAVLTKKLLHEVALEDADAALRSEYDDLDQGKK
jgi:hypothetical protein